MCVCMCICVHGCARVPACECGCVQPLRKVPTKIIWIAKCLPVVVWVFFFMLFFTFHMIFFTFLLRGESALCLTFIIWKIRIPNLVPRISQGHCKVQGDAELRVYKLWSAVHSCGIACISTLEPWTSSSLGPVPCGWVLWLCLSHTPALDLGWGLPPSFRWVLSEPPPQKAPWAGKTFPPPAIKCSSPSGLKAG